MPIHKPLHRAQYRTESIVWLFGDLIIFLLNLHLEYWFRMANFTLVGASPGITIVAMVIKLDSAILLAPL